MILRIVKYENLKNAIKIAFDEDKKIFEFYDPNSDVANLDEIVEDIYNKIDGYKEFSGGIIAMEVYEKNKLIGYFVYNNKMLISFGLNIAYRQRKYFKEFFNLMKITLGKGFSCMLWSKNIRAIKWLMKMGMMPIKENDFNGNFVTILIYI
jgi:hypothetical protein